MGPRSCLTAFLVLIVACVVDAAEPISECLSRQRLPRVGRVAGSDGRSFYVKVIRDVDGVPSTVARLEANSLAQALDLAAQPADASTKSIEIERWQIRSPVELPQNRIDSEQAVVVAAGLNYAAHAEEAGGGDVFLFPKPVAPTGAYSPLPTHAGVTLLDYEVELAFVLLQDVDLRSLPEQAEILENIAFVLANDVSDREPIIQHAALSGPGTGFVKGKGRQGYLPLGPWAVRGRELYAALAACGTDAMGIRLEVDEGEGFVMRQNSFTGRMILRPRQLLARIASEVRESGLRTSMPGRRQGRQHYYPIAIGGAGDADRLPAGSVILTGTPDGVALRAPNPFPLLVRGLVRMRSPFEQFRREQLERAHSKMPGGYLKSGDLVRASIDGLGTQIFRVGSALAR